jgi:hypothetical protein
MAKGVFLAAFVLVLGCSGTGTRPGAGGDGGPGPDAGIDAGSDTDTGTGSGGDGDGGTDASCHGDDLPIEFEPARLMILLDLSSSMGEQLDPEDMNSPTKWSLAQPAVVDMVTAYEDTIIFGIDVFPDAQEPGTTGDNDCTVVNPVKVDCKTDVSQNQAVIAYANGASPLGGSTPLYCGMNILDKSGYAPGFMDFSASRYLVVISDGADLCGEGCCTGAGTDCTATPEEFAALTTGLLDTSGIRTFAVGFGKEVGADEMAADQLDAIAKNGGTGCAEFFDAADGPGLTAALDSIAAAVVSCTYTVEDPGASADPSNVNFYFDDVIVGYDEGCAQGEGWAWTDDTHTFVTFCDAACDELRSGKVDAVSARYGCPTVPAG